MERVRGRIHAKTRGGTHRSLEQVIAELNLTLGGWDQYHTRVKGSADRRRKLNGYVRERIRAFLRRKHHEQARGWRRVPQDLHTRLGLYEFV